MPRITYTNANGAPTITVTLSHAPNPDVRPGGYWQEPVDPRRAAKICVASVEAASKACRDYITRNGLGGANWTGGEVRENGKVIGKVSYNGRFWTPEDEAEFARRCQEKYGTAKA